MTLTEEKKLVPIPHQLMLEDRQRLTVSGVSDVDSFDDTAIVVYTDMGELTIKGEGLHISRLNVETGDLKVEGSVQALTYAEPAVRGGFFGRLFK